MRIIDADELCEGRVENDPVRIAAMCAPTIEAAPVVHGEWVSNNIPDSMLSGCSVCGYPCGAYSFNFCPNCGADMRKKV